MSDRSGILELTSAADSGIVPPTAIEETALALLQNGTDRSASDSQRSFGFRQLNNHRVRQQIVQSLVPPMPPSKRDVQ